MSSGDGGVSRPEPRAARALVRRLRPNLPVDVAVLLAATAAEDNASQALVAGPCNAVTVDVIIINLGTMSSIRIDVEEGPDAANWNARASAVFRRPGHGAFRVRGIGSRFVRLRYSPSGPAGAKSLLAATLSGARL